MTKTSEILTDVMTRCAGVRTLSSARAVTRHYDAALRPADLTITQFTLLIVIGALRPSSISEIGNWLSIERTSVTRNLKPLERRGFIERKPEGAQRMRPVALTMAGQQKLKESYPYWQAAQTEIETMLGESELEKALNALAKLRSVDDSFFDFPS